jgi:hypothetical protein
VGVVPGTVRPSGSIAEPSFAHGAAILRVAAGLTIPRLSIQDQTRETTTEGVSQRPAAWDGAGRTRNNAAARLNAATARRDRHRNIGDLLGAAERTGAGMARAPAARLPHGNSAPDLPDRGVIRST